MAATDPGGQGVSLTALVKATRAMRGHRQGVSLKPTLILAGKGEPQKPNRRWREIWRNRYTLPAPARVG